MDNIGQPNAGLSTALPGTLPGTNGSRTAQVTNPIGIPIPVLPARQRRPPRWAQDYVLS